jgi:hypothetical protein|tara:strand:+ start:111 stop:701 length:591 start_codon:yes stop_codon:yes gene_type:complete
MHRRKIVYRRDPTDKPDIDNNQYMFFEEGTYQCYDLFKSKARINTYRSLKWHSLVLWYLNPQMNPEEFNDLAMFISNKENGFTTFNISQNAMERIIHDVYMSDLDKPPTNKLRKVIFKMGCGLDKTTKLQIVGKLIGASKRIHADDIYECMIELNDTGKKITISKLAVLLKCTSRTIHRNMCDELRREKELLNRSL